MVGDGSVPTSAAVSGVGDMVLRRAADRIPSRGNRAVAACERYTAGSARRALRDGGLWRADCD